MDPAVWFQEDMIMDCKLRAKNCGGCPMLATEYAAQLKKKRPTSAPCWANTALSPLSGGWKRPTTTAIK